MAELLTFRFVRGGRFYLAPPIMRQSLPTGWGARIRRLSAAVRSGPSGDDAEACHVPPRWPRPSARSHAATIGERGAPRMRKTPCKGNRQHLLRLDAGQRILPGAYCIFAQRGHRPRCGQFQYAELLTTAGRTCSPWLSTSNAIRSSCRDAHTIRSTSVAKSGPAAPKSYHE